MPAHQLAFTADGKRLVSLHLRSSDPAKLPRLLVEGSVVVWNLADGKPIYEHAKIYPGVLSPDGRLCTHESADACIEIYDLQRNRSLRTLDTHNFDHVFSADGKLLASVDSQNVVRLWEVASGRLLELMNGRLLRRSEERVRYLPFAFSPDGKRLLTGSWDSGKHAGPFLLWDVDKGEERLPAEDHFAAVTCLAFAADGKTLISGGADHVLHQWDTKSGRHLRRFTGPTARIDAVAFSANGRLLASSGRDKKLRLWDASMGRQLHALDAPMNAPLSLTFLADGKTLQWWGWNGQLHRYDGDSGKMIQSLSGFRGLYYATPLGPDGLDEATKFVRVSADGRMVAVAETISRGGLGGARCRIRVKEVATDDLIADLGETSGATCLLIFSRDGWGLFSAAERNGAFAKDRVQGWDLLSGKSVLQLTAPVSHVTCLAVSPDGTQLAAGHADGLMSVWNVAGLFHPSARPPLSAADLKRYGDRLVNPDAAAAYRAMHRLALCPEQSIPFLRERLRRFAPSQERLRQLLDDLDSPEFTVRETASQELQRLGLSAELALRRCHEKPPSLEVRRRIDLLLEKLNDKTLRKRRALQILREITILERIGTAPARAVLRELSATPDTDVGTEAEAALHRLEPQPIRRSRRD